MSYGVSGVALGGGPVMVGNGLTGDGDVIALAVLADPASGLPVSVSLAGVAVAAPGWAEIQAGLDIPALITMISADPSLPIVYDAFGVPSYKGFPA